MSAARREPTRASAARPFRIRLPMKLPTALLLLLAACGRADAPPPPPAASDSAVSTAEALRRFRADLPAAPTELGGGAAPTADALVERFARAIETRDTAALAAMALDRAEFAYLVYENNPQSRPPYELPPSLLWFQIQGNSRNGLLRALAQHGGKPLGYAGFTCAGSERQGPNLVLNRCSVRTRSPAGDTATISLFGSIIERAGKHKFLSYANAL